MNNTTPKDAAFKPIPPERVAEKLAAIRNYEQPDLLEQITERPRLAEMLWFLQAMSLRPGALRKFAEDLISEFPERLGTATMRKAKGKNYSFEQRWSVWQELPQSNRPALGLNDRSPLVELLSNNCTPEDLREMDKRERGALQEALKHWDAESFGHVCRGAALTALPCYLESLCTDQEQGFLDNPGEPAFNNQATIMGYRDCGLTWYFENTIGAVLEFMDRHAQRSQGRLAMTAVTKAVFETLDRASETLITVLIRGNSRFGKTESLKAFCNGRPGRARFVSVPASNAMQDFLSRVAEALGLEASYGSNTGRLRAKISYILKHSGLFLVFDEGAWLIPRNYSRSTSPQRMDWIRDELSDRGVPVAIAVTPQWYDQSLQGFVEKTSYAIEQFTGRCEKVTLPDKLELADLVEVAKAHFPEIKKGSELVEIASLAPDSENYLQAIDAIGKRARYAAKQNGQAALTMATIRKVIDQMFPPVPAKLRATVTARAVNNPLTVPNRGVKPVVDRPCYRLHF